VTIAKKIKNELKEKKKTEKLLSNVSKGFLAKMSSEVEEKKNQGKKLFHSMTLKESQHLFHPSSKLIIIKKMLKNNDPVDYLKKHKQMSEYKLTTRDPINIRQKKEFKAFYSGGPLINRNSLHNIARHVICLKKMLSPYISWQLILQTME